MCCNQASETKEVRGGLCIPSRGERRRRGRGRQPAGGDRYEGGQSLLVVLVDGVVEGELEDGLPPQRGEQIRNRRPIEMETAAPASSPVHDHIY